MRLFKAPPDTCLGSPFFSLSVHGLHFAVYAASRLRAPSVYLLSQQRLGDRLDSPVLVWLLLVYNAKACARAAAATGFQELCAPKSQRFLRFAIAMPIADPRHR